MRFNSKWSVMPALVLAVANPCYTVRYSSLHLCTTCDWLRLRTCNNYSNIYHIYSMFVGNVHLNLTKFLDMTVFVLTTYSLILKWIHSQCNFIKYCNILFILFEAKLLPWNKYGTFTETYPIQASVLFDKTPISSATSKWVFL